MYSSIRNQQGIQIAKSDARYDIAKFTLSLFIVAIHTKLFPELLYPWLRIAVPLFFLISGYFYFRKLNGVSDKQRLLLSLKNFTKRNLALYLFWTIVFLPVVIYSRRELIFSHGISGSPLRLLRVILLGNTFTGAWYIFSSVIAVWIIVCCFHKIPTKYLLLFSVPLYAWIVLTSSYPFLISDNSFLRPFLNTYSSIFGVPQLSFLVAIVWLSWGKAFAEDLFSFNLRAYVWICILSAALLYAEWYLVKAWNGTYNNDCYFMLLPLCFGLFGLISKLKTVSTATFVCLRRCSTVIFTAHGSIRTLLGLFYRHVLHIESSVLLFVSASLVCIGIYILIETLRKKHSSGIWNFSAAMFRLPSCGSTTAAISTPFLK